MAVILVLIGGLSLALWYSSYVGQPYEVGTVGSGEQRFSLPLMTYYSLAAMGPKGTSETSVTFTNATLFEFTWGNVSDVGVPVRFLVRANSTQAAAFRPGPTNGFQLWPVSDGLSSISFGVATGGRASVATLDVVMNYTIRRMAHQVGFGSESWIEVDYVLSSNSGALSDLPYGNVTAPTQADLLFAGNETVSLVAPWEFGRSLANFTQPATPFHHRVGAFAFSLGSAENLTAELTSSFTWRSGDRYDVLLTGRRDTTLNVTWYWDHRFGSLIAM